MRKLEAEHMKTAKEDVRWGLYGDKTKNNLKKFFLL